IMKKHISDPAPTFAEVGIDLPLEIEAAVRHTLQKDKDKRTPSVEVMIDELRTAVDPVAFGIHTTSGRSQPAASLNILTNPPSSTVYLNSMPVGQSREDGWLMLEGVQTGNHEIRVTHNGFDDWVGAVNCDGRPQRLVAQLRPPAGSHPMETVAFAGSLGQHTPHKLSSTHPGDGEMQKTAVQNWDTGRQHVGVQSQPPPKRSFFSPLVIGAVAFIGILGLGVLGLGGAYFSGIFTSKKAESIANPNTAKPQSPKSPQTPATPPIEVTKAELVAIPGGTFMMGRNEGLELEKPQHEVTVKEFQMDKTEVTNSEYSQFVEATGYKDIPAHWVNGKPIAGQEQMPVRFVNAADAEAFAAWRSSRDGVTYRLPTEQEWEYAARNGNADNLYPWGDKFESRCAMIDQANNEPAAAGTRSCPNSWGVQDLIGNVFEWTSSVAALYPGSKGEMKDLNEKHLMVRGGSSFQKSSGPNQITSAFRIAIPASRRSAELGFRLVRS
ncbi:MAG: SUMF1/EgtB/PvdO family nonheme iron enzyme, partial [Pyrinomonadaceae bacterium]